MDNLVLRNISRFLLLILLQVFVLDRIYLGGYISTFLFVLAILMLPTRMGKVPMLLLAFGTGLLVDLFSNMVGMHTFACTLVAFCRILFADKILTRGDADVDLPCFVTVGFQQFAAYLFILLFIYNFVYFFLAVFSLKDFGQILLSSLLSTVVVWSLSLIYHILFTNNKNI